MGQTLTNGIYLPDEGERNSYSGLEANWRTLDALILTIDGKAAPNVANTWTAAQTFTAGITGDLTGNVTGDLTGTASKAIADEAGNNIKSTYGKLSGNQTWTGFNTYEQAIRIAKTSGDSEIEIVNKNIDSTSNATTEMDDIRFMDKNGKITGGLRVTYNNTQVQNSLSARSWSSDGTEYSNVAINIVSNYQNSAAYISVTNDFLPTSTNTIRLGNASYQWSSVYAQTYYYNGTAWGLDKENQWLAKQIIKQDTIDITTNPSAEKIGKSLYFYDGSRFWAQYVPVWGTDGSFRMELGLSNYTTSGGQGYWVVANRISKDFTTLDFYTSHYNANLGTSTNKWKTLNGVNPGALSLPSGDWVVLDKTGITTDGTYSYITANIDGWLYMTIVDTLIKTDGELTVFNGNTALYGQNFVCSTDGYVRITIPVHNEFRIRFRINANGGTPVIGILVIYSCLGNV